MLILINCYFLKLSLIIGLVIQAFTATRSFRMNGFFNVHITLARILHFIIDFVKSIDNVKVLIKEPKKSQTVWNKQSLEPDNVVIIISFFRNGKFENKNTL